MGHPDTRNRTPFACEPLFLLDEHAHPVLTVVVKGTFTIGPGEHCRLADEQLAVNLAGETFGDDAASSSFRYEPEVAFFKPGTDVIMNGHAWAPRVGTTEMMVSLRIGPLRKDVRVSGERGWFKAAGQIGFTRPAPFEKLPLSYERAFGGWDRSHPDPKRHACDLRNPVGVGYRQSAVFAEGLRLPNLEDPDRPLKKLGDTSTPAAFGFVSPHWQPRAAMAGSYDQRWQQERLPLLPSDFDRRHLSSASPGLTAPGYLRGDESVTVLGAAARGALSFTLPAVAPPAVRIDLRRGDELAPATHLDTVIVEPDEARVLLIWRACTPLRSGPHDVQAITVSSERQPN